MSDKKNENDKEREEMATVPRGKFKPKLSSGSYNRLAQIKTKIIDEDVNKKRLDTVKKVKNSKKGNNPEIELNPEMNQNPVAPKTL